MPGHDLPHQREADPAAGGLPVHVPREPHEGAPHSRAVARRDPGPFVLDPEPGPPVRQREAEGDGLTAGAVLDRVVQQVEQHLAHRLVVHRRGDVVQSHGREPGLRCRRHRREPRHHVAHQRRQRLFLHPDLEPAAVAAEEEHVVHQPEEAARLAHDDPAGDAHVPPGAHGAQGERVAEEEDLGQRRAELVRDAGDELGAQIGQLERPPGHRGGREDEKHRHGDQRRQQRGARRRHPADEQLDAAAGSSRIWRVQFVEEPAAGDARHVGVGEPPGRELERGAAVGPDDAQGEERVVGHPPAVSPAARAGRGRARAA